MIVLKFFSTVFQLCKSLCDARERISILLLRIFQRFITTNKLKRFVFLSPFVSQIHSLIQFWVQYAPIYNEKLLASCPEMKPNSNSKPFESCVDSLMSIVNNYYVMSILTTDLEFVLNENSWPILVLMSDPEALQENVASIQNESVVSFDEVSVFYKVVQNVVSDPSNEIDMEIVNKILKCSFYYLITKDEQSWLIEMNTISRFFELTQENNSCFVFSYYLNNTEWGIWILLTHSLIEHLVSVLRIMFNSPDYLMIHHVESFMKILILAQDDDLIPFFSCLLKKNNFLHSVMQIQNVSNRLAFAHLICDTLQRNLGLKNAIWQGEVAASGRLLCQYCHSETFEDSSE